MYPAAICDRPALWTQTKRTVGFFSANINYLETLALIDAVRTLARTPHAIKAPTTWAATNAGTDWGEIPANESVKSRPIVTAGLAKDVDEVKK